MDVETTICRDQKAAEGLNWIAKNRIKHLNMKNIPSDCIMPSKNILCTPSSLGTVQSVTHTATGLNLPVKALLRL